MGSGKFDASAYAAYSSTTVGKSADEIYTSRAINQTLNPFKMNRESRDSVDNPNSTPVIVGIDVTGSMGFIAETLAKEGLGTLFTGIIDRKPIPDPHVMFMAIGDAYYDQAPLQVSQFEADKRIIEQLTQIYVEHGGGGNGFESYNLPWYFAANHTVHDSMEKRGKRGYLFTVGDEEAPGPITKEQVKKFIGDDIEINQDSKALLDAVKRTYDVFHVVIKEGSHATAHLDKVKSSWNALLGQHVIYLDDHKKLAETIVSAIEIAEGRDAAVSAKGWGSGTDKIVLDAVKNLPAGKSPKLIGKVA